jgi:hypothetical protein
MRHADPSKLMPPPKFANTGPSSRHKSQPCQLPPPPGPVSHGMPWS